jgi:hypothetical protein
VELAAQYMLTTDVGLSDNSLRCGFTDQAHLCKHFRRAAGQTPGAWRRALSSHHDENGTPPVERFATAWRSSAPSNAATQPCVTKMEMCALWNGYASLSDREREVMERVL